MDAWVYRTAGLMDAIMSGSHISETIPELPFTRCKEDILFLILRFIRLFLSWR